MQMREAQKHTDPTDPDPDAEPDPQHFFMWRYTEEKEIAQRSEAYERSKNPARKSFKKSTIKRRLTMVLNVVVALSIFGLTKAARLKGCTQAGAGHPQLSTAPTFKQK
jgi:hypothetical protein